MTAGDAGAGHHLGVFRFTGGMQPFSSVEHVWDQTIAALERDFRVTVHLSPDLDLRGSRSAARLLDAVDLGVLLLPYQRLPLARRTPLMVLALGSLHKGAPWLAAGREHFHTTDTLVVNSHACLQILGQIVDNPPMGVELVPLGVDQRVFHPCPPSAAVRRHLRIPSDAEILVYAGRLSLQKNIHAILGVLSRLHHRGRDTYLLLVGDFDDFTIHELGTAVDRPFAIDLGEEVDRLGLSCHVRHVPQVSQHELATVLGAADVGICLSTFPNENFGLAVVEMQACGLPLVVTDWGGHRDTSSNGRSARHVPTMLSALGPRFSVEVACDRVAGLLADDAGRAAAARAAAAVARRFSVNHFETSLRRAVGRALGRPDLVPRRPVGVKPGWLREMHRAIGAGQDLRWTHLDAVRHPSLYRGVLGPAATFTWEEVAWTPCTRLHRAFDWTVGRDGRLHSTDPRWAASLPMAQEKLSGPEREVLRMVETTDSVRHPAERLGLEACRAALAGLTRRGLVMPGWSMPRARRGTPAGRRSAPGHR